MTLILKGSEVSACVFTLSYSEKIREAIRQ